MYHGTLETFFADATGDTDGIIVNMTPRRPCRWGTSWLS